MNEIVIPISGVISRYNWDWEDQTNTTPKALREALHEADGKPVRIEINSPGGSVYEGLEMFNAIKNYPGHTETRIVGVAASMASIVALAGNKKTAESSAVYMIHNAMSWESGDYRDLRKTADQLEAMSAHLARIYERHGGVENPRELMDAETWAYGDEIVDFGFEVIAPENPTEEEIDMTMATMKARERFQSFKAEMQKHADENRENLSRAVASFAPMQPKAQTTKKPAIITADKKQEKKEAVLKNLAELKEKYPELYAEALEQGVQQEKDRVQAHLTMGKAGNCLELAVKNISEDKGLTQAVHAEYMAEGLKKRDAQNRMEDNPPTVQVDGAGVEAESQEEFDKAVKDCRASLNFARG